MNLWFILTLMAVIGCLWDFFHPASFETHVMKPLEWIVGNGLRLAWWTLVTSFHLVMVLAFMASALIGMLILMAALLTLVVIGISIGGLFSIVGFTAWAVTREKSAFVKVMGGLEWLLESRPVDFILTFGEDVGDFYNEVFSEEHFWELSNAFGRQFLPIGRGIAKVAGKVFPS